MALSVVFGLAVLSAAANYGAAFEFSGLDPSFHSKAQFKPFDKPFSSLSFQPRLGESVKPFGFKNAAAKPFGAPFDPFKPSYYQQPGPFRANYQPFGPYPGYPGPVVYPGHGAGYSAPSAYPQPAYRFGGADQKPDFGYQPFPTAAVPQPQPPAPFKSGSPAKKYTKPVPDFSDLPAGKYFYEHQFGMNHGPEFSSAIVPAEHHIKQSRPKDSWLLNKPAVPSLNEFGFPKPSAFGFAPPSSFKYPVPQFSSPIQSSVNTLPSDKSVSTTIVPVVDKNNLKFGGAAAAAPVAVSTESPSQDESATARSPDAPAAEEVTSSAAADPQPTNPSSQEGVTATAEVSDSNNQVSAAADGDSAAKEQSEQSGPAESGETVAASPAPSFGSQETDSPVAASDPVVVEPVQENGANAVDEADKPAAAAQENDAQVPSTESAGTVESGTVAPANDPSEPSAAVSGSAAESNAPKSEEVKENETANKPAESEAVSGSPSLPNEPFGAPLPLSNPSTPGLFASSGGFPPYFGEPTADFQQPPFIPYYDAPKFTDEQLKSYIADFGTGLPAADFGTGLTAAGFGAGLPAGNFGTGFPVQPVLVPGSADAAAVTPTESSVPVSSSAPSIESGEKSEIVGEKAEISGEKVQESGEKKEPTVTSDSESRSIPEAPKKINTVQILPEDPFNGQLPLLFDPSNTASPLDAYRFYNHPTVSALSSQASLAAYSPEDAFTNFGTQFRQGYLVEGSPSLTPVTKTFVQAGQSPLSISSAEHPLHSQVFKYSQSFVPYPGLVADNAPAFRSLEAPSSTVVAAAAAADAAAATTPAADTVSSTAAAAEAVTESDSGSTTVSA